MKPTLKEIAAAAGVSTMSVSRVLSGKKGKVSEKVAAMIRETARQMGYRENRLAKAMRTGVIPLVAFCLHEFHNNEMPNLYWFDVIQSAKHSFAVNKFEVLFITYSTVEELSERITSLRDANMIGGVISNLLPGREKEICQAVRECGLPAVIFGEISEEENIPYSYIDDSELTPLILEKLRCRGAEKLVWYAPYMDLPPPEEAADEKTWFQVGSELLKSRLIRLCGIPEHRVVIASNFEAYLGGHGGFTIRSHTVERCRYALETLQEQMYKRPVSRPSMCVKLTAEDVRQIDPL